MEDIDEKTLFATLDPLINGMNCSTGTQAQIQSTKKIINVLAGEIVDALRNDSSAKIYFDGMFVDGGILQDDGSYLSDNMKLSFRINDNALIVESICKKITFTIINFSKTDADFGIFLREKPYKELGIVYCNCIDMQEYIVALQSIAPSIVKRIFKKDFYSKVFLNNYTSRGAENDLRGPFFEQKSFEEALLALQPNLEYLFLLNSSIFNVIRNFTKFNRLKKEIYLFANQPMMHYHYAEYEKLVALIHNLNANIVKDQPELEINKVVFHTIAIDGEVEALKRLSEETGGNYAVAYSTFEFKRILLTQMGEKPSSDELGNEIVISKNHKMQDDNPPK